MLVMADNDDVKALSWRQNTVHFHTGNFRQNSTLKVSKLENLSAVSDP